MTKYVGLLRAVNLGPHKKIAMSDLKRIVEELGFSDVRTLLNSGNVIFSAKGSTSKLEQQIEAALEEEAGMSTDVMVRTHKEIADIIARNPFDKEAKSDPSHLVVIFGKPRLGKTLKVTGQRRERYEVVGREVYIVYPDGIGTSKLKIDAYGTARNWNTVLKLAK